MFISEPVMARPVIAESAVNRDRKDSTQDRNFGKTHPEDHQDINIFITDPVKDRTEFCWGVGTLDYTAIYEIGNCRKG